MFYIIETEYVGPNTDQHCDSHIIEISSEAARMNMSQDVCINGWCGTTNDWSVHAHGIYESLEAACQAVIRIFGVTRDCGVDGQPFESEEACVIDVYKPGQNEPMCKEHTIEWVYDDLSQTKLINLSDAEVKDLVAKFELAANSEGYTLDDSLESYIVKMRDELRD